MSTYKYETHLHTLEGSACGTSSGSDYIEPFYKAGYSGLFVTDHFFGGNTAAPREGKWEDRVKIYCSGYEKALAAAKEFNEKHNLSGTDKEFKVFFGIEQTFDGDDYLLYGLSPQWLLDHPEIERMRHGELFETINKENALMIQAHPFRVRNYIKAVHVHFRDIHGIEILNAGNSPEENQLAELYASIYKFPVTAGSDIHNISKLEDKEGIPVTGMEFDTPLKSIDDYITRIKNFQGRIIRN